MNVSIIIPAYNAEKTLRETLESVLAQTSPAWEAIIVNDGSTDATPTIAKRLTERSKKIRVINKRNGGESAARNTGLSYARQNWVLFLDADDLILPHHLERMTAALGSDAMLDGLICGSARIARDGTLLVEPYLPPAGDLFPVLARRAAFPVHACIIRRSCVESVGRFDASLRTSPDWDLWQRIARTGARFGTIPDVLALYRMSPHSASQEAHQIFKDGLRILRQGHAPDPRVKKPHPDHANGEPPEGVTTQVFYLLSWCAGILIGQGEDARPLLSYITSERFPKLYPEAVAQCIFDSANLPSCRAPHDWEELWPTIHDQTVKFLSALEVTAGASDLSRRASASLKSMILKQSKTWQPVIEGIDEIRKLSEEQRTYWQHLAEERAQTLEQQRTSLAESERTRAVLDEQLHQAHDLAETRLHSLSDLQSRLATLEQARAALDQERKDTQRLAEERAQTLEQQRASFTALEQTKILLVEQVAQARRLAETRIQTINDLQSRIARLEQAEAELEKAQNEAQGLAHDRAHTIEEQRAVIEDLEATTQRLTSQHAQVQGLADERAQTIDHLRAGYSEWEQMRALLTNQLADAKRSSEERDQAMGALRTKLGELEQARVLLQEELNQASRTIDERARTIEQQQASLSGLEQAHALVKQQLAQAQQLAEERGQTIEQQRDGIYELRRVQARRAEQLKQAQQTNKDQSQTVHNLQCRLDELEYARSQMATAIEGLNRAQAHLEEQLAQAQRQSEERAHTTEKLQTRLAELERARESVELERSSWQALARGRETELSELRRQVWVRLGRRLRILQDYRKQGGANP